MQGETGGLSRKASDRAPVLRPEFRGSQAGELGHIRIGGTMQAAIQAIGYRGVRHKPR